MCHESQRVVLRFVNLVGRDKGQGHVTKLDQGRGHPGPKDPEVVVKHRACSVLERLFSQLIGALIGNLQGVFHIAHPRMTDFYGDGLALEHAAADHRAVVGSNGIDRRRQGLVGKPLQAKDDLDFDRRVVLQDLLDIPTAVGGLAPTRPIERDVSNGARRTAFPRQSVTGFPDEIPEENVGLKVFLERLALQEGIAKSVAQRTDRIGKHMVQHRPQRYSWAMSLVSLEVTNGVATLTLNHPEERNTLTAPMVAEIVAAMERIEADDQVGAVVVTGAGSAFCAGANLGNLAEATAESLGIIYEGFLRIARCPLPTIAAVNGAAVGAGMNLALSCDVRIAAHRARFDTRFAQLGIHSGGGHTWLMRRAIGEQSAKAMILFGEVLSGEDAARLGLVWKCVDDALLLAEAQQLAARAAGVPRELAIELKRSIGAMADIATHAEAVDYELVPQVWSTKQPWFAERLAAIQARISQKS